MAEESIPDQIISNFLESIKDSEEFPGSKLDELKKMLTSDRSLNKKEFLKILSFEE